MIISISGDLGSGKSTVGKKLAKKLETDFFSTGDFMGEIALERGVSLLELSEMAEKSDEIDKLLDKHQIQFGKEKETAVLDSRLGWYFIPHAIKIFLTVDPFEAAKRIFNDNREDEKENVDLEATKNNIIRRKESERLRYKKYYNLDYDNPDNFNLIIDTTNLSPEEVVNEIIYFMKSM